MEENRGTPAFTGGYVKLYRSLLNKGYWEDPEYIKLWLYLLLNATFYPREYLAGGKILELKQGQLITGRRKLAEALRINEYKVLRILKCFENEQQIAQEGHSKYTIITILNWDKYQGSAQQDAQLVHNTCTTRAQHVHTNIRKKEGKNVYNTLAQEAAQTDFEKFWAAYPKKKSKLDAVAAWKQTEKIRPPIEELLKKLARQRSSEDWKREDWRYVPYPATWLRAGGWDDVPGDKNSSLFEGAV